MSTESDLGAICLAVDGVQIRRASKLKSVKPGSVDGFYMLATYAFDLARKMEYVYKATREFARQADPKLAAEIKRDNDALDALGTDWKARAEKAEEIILRLYNEIGEEHEKLLEQVAGKGR